MNVQISNIKKFLESKGFTTQTINLSEPAHFIGFKDYPTGAQFFVNAYFNRAYNKDFIILTVFDKNISYNVFEDECEIETIEKFIKDYNCFIERFHKKATDAVAWYNNIVTVFKTEMEGK